MCADFCAHIHLHRRVGRYIYACYVSEYMHTNRLERHRKRNAIRINLLRILALIIVAHQCPYRLLTVDNLRVLPLLRKLSQDRSAVVVMNLAVKLLHLCHDIIRAESASSSSSLSSSSSPSVSPSSSGAVPVTAVRSGGDQNNGAASSSVIRGESRDITENPLLQYNDEVAEVGRGGGGDNDSHDNGEGEGEEGKEEKEEAGDRDNADTDDNTLRKIIKKDENSEVDVDDDNKSNDDDDRDVDGVNGDRDNTEVNSAQK